MSVTVEIDGLTKYFPARMTFGNTLENIFGRQKPIVALEDVTFKVGQGEIFGLIGPNGAGKTTLLKILATLILPSKGSARVKGYEVAARPDAVRGYIGLVSSEDRSLYWRLSGKQNLEFFAAFCGLPKRLARSKIDELSQLLDIPAPDRMVGKYSAGMKQRLSLARGLLHDPAILLMDEPTRSLDPGGAGYLCTFARDYLCGKKGKTIIWATHSLPEAQSTCDRIGLLNRGRIIAQGSLDELRQRTGLQRTASLDDIYKAMT